MAQRARHALRCGWGCVDGGAGAGYNAIMAGDADSKTTWEKRFDELTFCDDFVFKLVMDDEQAFKTVLGVIMPQLEVQQITSLESEDPLSFNYFTHGVVFDIQAKLQAKDSGGGAAEYHIDFEMQVLSTGEEWQRALYYLCSLVSTALKRGESYGCLPECCVVFICKFDPLGQGLPVYTYELVCKEDASLQVSPNIRIVFINAAAWQKCTDGELRAFSCYVMTGAASTAATHLVAERTAQVKRDNSKEARFMGIYEAVDQIVARKAPEWLSQGRTEGTHNTRVDTARRALERGLAPDVVSEITGLPIEDVEALL